jgi:hypothetical protein
MLSPTPPLAGTARALTPKRREEIVHRDAYLCANPGCHLLALTLGGRL